MLNELPFPKQNQRRIWKVGGSYAVSIPVGYAQVAKARVKEHTQLDVYQHGDFLIFKIPKEE